MLGICDSLSRICHVLVHFGSRETRHPFKWLSPSIARVFHTWGDRRDMIIWYCTRKTLPFSSCKFHLDQDQLAFYPFHFQYSLGLCNIIKKYFSTACLRKLQSACDSISRIGNSPRCFMSCAFLLSPLSESPRHLNQNFSSSFFSEWGFLPAKEAPGISSSEYHMRSFVRSHIFGDLWTVAYQPRFQAFEFRPFCAAAFMNSVYTCKL